MEEDEIDLREYVALLLRHWKLVLGLPILAALAAFMVSTFVPSYQATVLITVATPQTLTARAANLPGLAKSYISLATSDGVMNQLLADPALASLPIKQKSLEALRKIATAGASSADPSVIVLTVKYSDAAWAAAIANAWASAFSDELSRQEQSDLTALQAQVLEGDQRLKQADADLAAYQASNAANIAAVRLSAQEAILADHLSRRYLYTLIIKDAQDQSARLAQLDATAPASAIDSLAILTLLQRYSSASAAPILSQSASAQPASNQSYQSGGAQGNSPAAPLQVQITDSFLAGKTVGAQIAYLDTLISSLQARVTEIDGLATALEPEILSLQEKLSAAAAGEAQLVATRDLAKEAYQAQVHKMDDARLMAIDESNSVHVGQRANIPTAPTSSRLTSVAMAGIVALILAVAGILGWEWWRQETALAKR